MCFFTNFVFLSQGQRMIQFISLVHLQRQKTQGWSSQCLITVIENKRLSQWSGDPKSYVRTGPGALGETPVSVLGAVQCAPNTNWDTQKCGPTDKSPVQWGCIFAYSRREGDKVLQYLILFCNSTFRHPSSILLRDWCIFKVALLNGILFKKVLVHFPHRRAQPPIPFLKKHIL